MKTHSYSNFWQRIHNSAKEKGLPLRVMFELTYRCNFSCRHCYVPLHYRKHNELTTKEVFSIIDQLRDCGCFYLGFTGGEPFVRDDIIDILWYAKKSGFQIIIYTNGSLIDTKQVKELVRLKPNKVDITIPAMSKDVFDLISGVSGSREKVFRTIDLLRRHSVPLGFKTCVLKENEHEISKIQDFAASLGALHRLDDKLLPCLDGSEEPYKHRGSLFNVNSRKSNATLRQAQGSVLSEIEGRNSHECSTDKDSSENSRLPVSAFNADRPGSSDDSCLFKCGIGETQAAITPLGELKMCLMIDYPKYRINTKVRGQGSEDRIQETDLKGAWKGLKKLVASIKPDEHYKCPSCELEPYCTWCPGNAWLQNRNFTSCDIVSRRWAAQYRKKLR